MKRLLLALLIALIPSMGWGQGAVLQGGSWQGGHLPMYSGQGSAQPIVQDSGPASGGAVGVNPSELGITARGTGTPPYAGQGTGEYGSNFCVRDAPITNATGYHYLCMSANAQGGGLLAYGNGGGSAILPFRMVINGAAYDFPFVTGGIVGPSSTVAGHLVCWNNTVGTLVSDCGEPGNLAFINAGASFTIVGGNTLTLTPTIAGATNFGSATTSPTLSYNNFGQLTAVGLTTITPSYNNITSLPTQTILCNFGGSTANALACTGFQAFSVLQFIQTGTGAVTMSLGDKIRQMCVNVNDFGADPTNTLDSVTAFNNAYQQALSSGRPMCIGAGTYRLASQLTWDLATNTTTGVVIKGQGPYKSILNFTLDAVPAPNLTVYSSLPAGIFYTDIGEFAVASNVNGPAMQIGANSFADAFNSCRFSGIVITNPNGGGSAGGMKINYAVNCTFSQIVANGASKGTGSYAIQLNQSISNVYNNIAGGHTVNALHITNGSNYGNTFNGWDAEESTTGVRIDTANGFANTWNGGTVAVVDYFANASAGYGNYFTNMVTGLISISRFNGANYVGIVLNTPGQNFISTPAVPASTVAATNTTGQRAYVFITGGTVNNVKVNAATVSNLETGFGVVVNPGDTITIDYSVSPGWTWLPLW